MNKKLILAALAVLTFAVAPVAAFAQASNGKVTTSAPTYTTGTLAPLSLDTSGSLRVVDTGGASGTQDVNLIELAGTPVGATVAGALDVTCVSGCVAGSGVSQGTATTAPPTYVDSTNNALSLDLAGNLRVSNLTALPAGTNNIGDVDVLTLPSLPAGTNNIGDVDVLTLPTLTLTPSATSSFGIAASTTSAADDELVLKASAGNLYSVYATAGATAGYLMIFDATSAPADGAVTPAHCIVIPANMSGGMNFDTPGVFATGITAVFSSTGCFTKTASATAFISGSVK